MIGKSFMGNTSVIAGEFLEQGKSEVCPVIDMHGHYGPFQGIYFPNPYAGDMLRTLDRCGVKLIICSSHASLVDTGRGNALMAEVIAAYPGRFFGYWTVNPNYSDMLNRDVERFQRERGTSGKAMPSGFVGFKFHPGLHNYPLTGDGYKPALEYANEHGLIVLMHTWGHNALCGPSPVRTLAEKYPRVTFLMGHSGYGEWKTSVRVARDYPNAYLELTAAYAPGGTIEFMVKEVGSEKIVFGTDLPWFDPHYGIGCVVFSHISDEDRHNILHRNAERLLGLWI